MLTGTFSVTNVIRRYKIRASLRKVLYRTKAQLHNGLLEENPTITHAEQEPWLDHSLYASLLRLHGETKALPEGRVTHHHIIKRKYEEDVFLGNLALQMYGKCGALQEAHFLFAGMHQRDVFTWTFIISAYTHAGHEQEALHLFDRMQHEAVAPSKFTFVEILSACAKRTALIEGKRVHARIFYRLIEPDVVVENALVHFYGKCSNLDDAWRIFSRMGERDVVSWNTMLTTYNQHGQGNVALQLFWRMLQEGLIPNKVTLACISDACVGQAALADSKRIHTHIVGCGLGSDVGVCNTLVCMYARCGSINDALSVFLEMLEHNVVSWTTLIAAYAQHGLCNEAVLLFIQMQLEGVLPNNVTFLNVISACASRVDLSEGIHLHAQIAVSGYELDVVIGNALINMYGKCRNVEKARKIFDEMPKRDTISWNSLIAAYALQGHSKEALQLFREMHQFRMSPDRATSVSVLEVCANELALDEGKEMHTYINNSWVELDSVLGSALVNMYGKCGSLENAQEVFYMVPDRTVVLWTAMISAYVQHGQRDQALQLFGQMKLEGTVPDALAFSNILSACLGWRGLDQGKQLHACILGCKMQSEVVFSNALLSMYGKCGSLMDAKKVFRKLVNRSVVSWTAMITAFAQSGQPKQALYFFEQMLSDGVVPNKLTFASLLDACTKLGALAEGNHIYELLLISGFEPDVILGTAVVNLYSKCGIVEDAHWIFYKMPERNVASWNSIIAAYCQHGDVNKARQLFRQMQQEDVSPDEVTFLTIISSFSHAGLVDEAQDFFVSMGRDHGLTPTVEHYNCMIDLLGRAGHLDNVEEMLAKLPFEATSHSWMSLLSACRVHLDAERGERAVKSLTTLEPANHAPQVLLSNIYAAVGRFEEAAMVRKD